MKKIRKNLLILFVIIFFIEIIIDCGTGISKTTIVNGSIKKDILQTIKEKGVLTVAAANDTPFFYIDSKTNELTGIDADIIYEIAKRLGINKVEMKAIPFSNLLERLNTDNSIDIATAGIYITAKREEIVAFTQPLYKESEVIVVPKASKINFMNDLKNAVVGVQKGTAFVDLAQKWKANGLIKDIVIFENNFELLDAINIGKIHAGITDSVVANYSLLKNKNLFLRTLKDYTPELPGIVGISVRKSDTTLLNALNEKINEMKADGTLYAIFIQNGLNKNNIIDSK